MLLKSGRTGATETVESPWYGAPYVPTAFLGLLPKLPFVFLSF